MSVLFRLVDAFLKLPLLMGNPQYACLRYSHMNLQMMLRAAGCSQMAQRHGSQDTS